MKSLILLLVIGCSGLMTGCAGTRTVARSSSSPVQFASQEITANGDKNANRGGEIRTVSHDKSDKSELTPTLKTSSDTPAPSSWEKFRNWSTQPVRIPLPQRETPASNTEVSYDFSVF